MAIVNGANYDHLDIQSVVGGDTVRHMYQDTAGRAMLAPTEASSTAIMAHVPGTDSEFFVYNNKLYHATVSIAQGGTITPNTNCEEAPLGKSVSELKSAVNDQSFLSGLLNSGVGENGFFKYNLRYYPQGTDTIVTGGNYYTSPYVNIKSLGAEISYNIPSSISVNILTIFNSSFEYIGYSDTVLTREQILTSYPTAEWVRYSCFNTDLSSLSITPIWNVEISNVNGLVTINARDILSTCKVTNALFNNKFADLFSEVGYYTAGTGNYNASGNYHTTPFILIEQVKDIDISYDHPNGASASKVTLLNASGEYVGLIMMNRHNGSIELTKGHFKSIRQ